MIRAATLDDLDQLVHLGEQEHHRLESGRDTFYAAGPKFEDGLREKMSNLIPSKDAVCFVDESGHGIDGCLLGRLVNAPPVYDPGGKVTLIDTLVASSLHLGADLLATAAKKSRDLGGVLLCVEARHNDTPKLSLLAKQGFTVASDWYYRDTNLPEPGEPLRGTIEKASKPDVPAMVQLCELRRLEYAKHQPLFWKKAADSAEKQAPFLEYLLGVETHEILVHKLDSRTDGMIDAEVRQSDPTRDLRGTWCATDDFSVSTADGWDSVGAWLLHEAVKQCCAKGARFTQIVCSHKDEAKRKMLEKTGYSIGHQWWVKPV